MAPDQDTPRGKAARDEYEVAYYTKELGRPLQRKLLQHRLEEINDGSISSASAHGEEPSNDHGAAPPRDDRAG
jgi:hypothetical protein